MTSSNPKVCVLCEVNNEKSVQRFKGGLQTLINSSFKRSDNNIHEKLVQLQLSHAEVFVHFECRRDYNDLRHLNNHTLPPPLKRLRLCDDIF